MDWNVTEGRNDERYWKRWKILVKIQVRLQTKGSAATHKRQLCLKLNPMKINDEMLCLVLVCYEVN